MAKRRVVANVVQVWLIPPARPGERGVLRFEEESGRMTEFSITLDHAQALSALAEAALGSWPSEGRS